MSTEVTFPTTIDFRGSILIPKKIRDALDIEEGDVIYIRIVEIQRKENK